MYNQFMGYQIMRTLLFIYAVGAFALSISYLRYRRCSVPEYAFWGVLAFILPVIGPFFVISARPGPHKRLKRPGLDSQVIISPKG